MRDARTVAWKELREIVARSPRGGRRIGGLSSLLLTVAIFGVALPLGSASTWTGLPAIAVAAMAAALTAMTIVPDAFAGERDRGTLETLLASRLSARSILAGKLISAVVVSVAVSVLVLVASLVTVNASGSGRGLDIYSPLDVLAAVGLSLMAATLVANIGITIALRAHSAMSAQRVMALGLVVVSTGAGAAFSALPASWRSDLERLAANIGDISPVLLVLTAIALFAAINVALYGVAVRLFQRPKLLRS